MRNNARLHCRCYQPNLSMHPALQCKQRTMLCLRSEFTWSQTPSKLHKMDSHRFWLQPPTKSNSIGLMMCWCAMSTIVWYEWSMSFLGTYNMLQRWANILASSVTALTFTSEIWVPLVHFLLHHCIVVTLSIHNINSIDLGASMTRFRVRSPPPHGREQSDLTRCVQSPFNSLQILQFIWRCGACCNISMTHDVVVTKVTRTQTSKYERMKRSWLTLCVRDGIIGPSWAIGRFETCRI